jgi:hypothetical protein
LNDKLLNRLGSVCSVVPFIWSGLSFFEKIYASAGSIIILNPNNLVILTGLFKLYTILFLGLLVAIVHGILWSIIERMFHWDFGAGGGESLPKGWQAVILSATMSIPLVLLPMFYERLTQTKMLVQGHSLAAIVVAICAALAHLLLYGTTSPYFRGLKNIIFPLEATLNWRRAILMELVYAIIYFGSIVLPYRIIVGFGQGILDFSVIKYTLLSAALFFFGACVFIFVRYPDSLSDKRWIQVRGVVNALVLTVALQGGMLI